MSTIISADSLTVAGRTIIDPNGNPDFKILSSGYTPTNGAWSGMVDNTGASYQVPGGKIFRVIAIRHEGHAGPGTTPFGECGYADASVPRDTTTPPTNPIYFSTWSSTIGNTTWVPDGNQKEYAVDFKTPASKYLFFKMTLNIASVFWMFGFEE